jgi:predicted metalloprotease with PDZ domain
MIRHSQAWMRALALAAMIFLARPANATIDYAVSIAHPERHVFAVTMNVPGVRDQLTLQMPSWNALYQIRDFASHMMPVSAQDASGKPLPIEKLDKQTWRVTGSGAVTLSYPIFWDDPGPFNSQLNPDHAFLNLAMILLYVPDRRAEDTRVEFDGVPASWRVAVELDGSGTPGAHSASVYVAPSYDALVDAPVEIGAFEELRFEAGGRPIRVVVHGDYGDRGRLTDALKRIVDYQVALMGGAPFREYMFMFHVGQNFGGGGMEHSNCTAIAADIPAQLPSYSAHEFFHTWNVKRIRPQALEPVDYTKEMWTRSLWFAEGVTNTYEMFTLVRTGLWSPQQFYRNMAAQVSELESRPAHKWQSAEQSSLDAWFEKYTLYTRPEESVSYYNKGQLLGDMLDILIRDRTDNRASLDDVLRALNVNFAQRGRFYQESEDLRAVAENVIRGKSPEADANLGDFFRRYVSGTDEIPFSDFLGRAGLTIRDTGQRRAAFGFAITREGGGPATVGSVDPDSSADRAGLKDGDILLALDGDVFPRSPDRWLRDHQPEEHATVRVRRSNVEVELSFVLERQSDAIYQITEIPGANEKQIRIRNGILHGVTDSSR